MNSNSPSDTSAQIVELAATNNNWPKLKASRWQLVAASTFLVLWIAFLMAMAFYSSA